MKQSIKNKLQLLAERREELSSLLASNDVIMDQSKFRSYSKEYADLSEIVTTFESYQELLQDLEAARELGLEDSELKAYQEQITEHETKLEILMLPKDPNDNCNIFLEIRAAAGGDESAIFAGDLFRMYAKFCENRGWKYELISANAGEHGGYKELIMRIAGTDVFANLKFESGAHRVQRVPVTEAQGRVHTSTCTVAIMPELETIDSVDIKTSDLKIDTFRASGAGGQHVNKTDSAIRITHLPTGTVVECQDERSQHKNKAKAMSLLASKLLTEQKRQQNEQQAQTRRNLVGTGDRSERIRTYNYPQGRVSDHRINLTLYKLPEIMEGELDSVIAPLLHEHQLDLLASIE